MNEQPTNRELMDAVSRLDGKIDAVYYKLGAKIDSIDLKLDQAVVDITSSVSEFATDANKRLNRLEAFHA